MNCQKCPVEEECNHWKRSQVALFKPDIEEPLGKFCPLANYEVLKSIKVRAAELAFNARMSLSVIES